MNIKCTSLTDSYNINKYNKICFEITFHIKRQYPSPY